MKDGGPAFPITIFNTSRDPVELLGVVVHAGTQQVFSGMTVRQFAAIMAMQGMLAGLADTNIGAYEIAEFSAKQADALLAVLAESEER